MPQACADCAINWENALRTISLLIMQHDIFSEREKMQLVQLMSIVVYVKIERGGCQH